MPDVQEAPAFDSAALTALSPLTVSADDLVVMLAERFGIKPDGFTLRADFVVKPGEVEVLETKGTLPAMVFCLRALGLQARHG